MDEIVFSTQQLRWYDAAERLHHSRNNKPTSPELAWAEEKEAEHAKNEILSMKKLYAEAEEIRRRYDLSTTFIATHALVSLYLFTAHYNSIDLSFILTIICSYLWYSSPQELN